MFTYDLTKIDPVNGTLPSNVRYLLQDTDSTAQEFSDEEIAAVWSTVQSPSSRSKIYRVACTLARARARYYGRLGAYEAGELKIDIPKVVEHWEKVATEMVQMAGYLEQSDTMSIIQGAR